MSDTSIRVLQIIDSLVPAGAEQSLAAMAPHLMANDIDLHVAYLHEREGLAPRLRAMGVPLHPLTAGSGRRAWYREAAELINEVAPDVVHTSLFEADLAGRLAGARRRVPIVSSLVNTAYGEAERSASGLPRHKVLAAQAVDAATSRLVSRFHAVTPYVAEVMGKRLLIPQDRIQVIPRGRDAAFLGSRTADRRAQMRSRLGVGADRPLILAIGRQERQKGLDVLLRAVPGVIEHRPDVRVFVAGRPGNATPELKGILEQLGLVEFVTFLGARDDVPDLLAAADVFAFPSRWEGAAGTVIEAMALECPIVATDLATLAGTIDRGTALLVPQEDPSALAEAIGSVLEDPEGSKARAAVGRQRFLDHFTIEQSSAAMASLYRAVAR